MLTYIVYPTEEHQLPPAPKQIALHGLDLAPPIQIQNHRFFRPAHDRKDLDAVVDILKKSLARALELYPPVAGSVRANELGENYIDTTPIGTPFIVETRSSSYTGDSQDFTPRTDPVLSHGSSNLAVKVTQFSCGTLCVASSINHQITDLRGFLDFLETWAGIARGEPVNVSRIPKDWHRTPRKFFPKGNIVKTCVEPPPGFEVLATPGVAAYLLAPATTTRWQFSKVLMEQLKNDFSAKTSSGEWISSGDALVALLWSAIERSRNGARVSRAKELGRSGEDCPTETIVLAADGRERCPDGKMLNGQYFGNFNPLYATTVQRSDLLSSDVEASARVAGALRKALNAQLTPEALLDKIDFFEDPQHLTPPGRIVLRADVIGTNWSRNDLQSPRLDFGWGKPFAASPGASDIYPPGYFLITYDTTQSNTHVILSIEEQAADLLKNDKPLNQYGKLVG